MKSAKAISLAVFLAVAVSAAAQTSQTITDMGTLGTQAAPVFTHLYDFSNIGDPNLPQGHFAQARDGNLYNTSLNGGANGYGTVFQLTPAGKMKVLWSFTGVNAQGGFPQSGLTLGTDGNLYGTTIADGTNNAGTIFRITTAGTLTVLHNFSNTTEGNASNAPIQSTSGNFYGTTGDGNSNYGTVYKMSRSGLVTVIYTFTGSPTGDYRYPRGLIQATDGNFYGTTLGAPFGLGMVFKISAQGKLTKLHQFAGGPSDGQFPYGSLTQGRDGNFYGTTEKGGTDGAGTIYKITPAGGFSILVNFHVTGDLGYEGYEPFNSPIQATDGNFYGGTYGSGAYGRGILYQWKSDGTYTDLYDGFNDAIGVYPVDPMIQHTNGTFYGDTYGGGRPYPSYGTLYSLSMGLDPFVSFVGPQSSGKVGSIIQILGQGFTGTSAVSFNGTPASFKVVSDTYLTATVPSDATTGTVTVATTGGSLQSNKPFRVIPAILSFSPTSGPVGTSVTITGTGLTGATRVTFGGVEATSFVVNSATRITATVPTGAKTGKIQVTTAGGVAASSTKFTVTP